MAKTIKKNPVYLSKTLYLKGLQCPKALYLDKYHPELRDDLSESKEARFRSGLEVGALAQGLFPGGKEIPYEDLSKDNQLKMTQGEIAAGRSTLYEAAFRYDNIFVKADIINKGRRGWDLYEVKSSSEIKDVNLEDISLQYHVIEKSGLPIHKAHLVYINREYVRKGDLDLDELFLIEDVTKQAREKQTFVQKKITKLKKMLAGKMPEIDIGEHCDDPYPCDFQGHCWEHVPDYSVLDVSGRFAARWDLYRQGIVHFKDIPMEMLSSRQKIEVEAFLEQKWVIDKKALKEFLDSLWYPLYFLDFETFMPAIPLFDGTRPFQQIPFQYSLHYLNSPRGKLLHREYLAEPNADPRKDLVESLLSHIPPEACVLSYNATFERTILKQLVKWFPKHRLKLEKIIDNLNDLAVPFRRKDFYHWAMKGSFSQKYVLPALAPELSYEGLEISEGGMAMEAYFRMCQARSPEAVEKIRIALLEYCRMDTLGMVRLFQELIKSCK